MNFKNLFFAMFIPMLLTAFGVVGQSKEIKGKITDIQSGEPVSSATIRVIEGKSSAGATSDEDGNFTVKVRDANTAKLMVSHINYNSQVIEINGREELSVALQSNVSTLQDVVVIGYGTQKKKLLTGAVTKLENTNLDEVGNSRLDNALQGKLAGVSIQNVDNEAGAAPRVRIRGTSSLSANADPLIVVDGTPVPDGLGFVNPYDVESIEVLKDAASSAIYGSRGANGVILITTKQGVAGKPKYTVKSYYGVKQAYKLNPIMSFSQYADKMFAEAAMREDDPTVPANKKNLISNPERASYIIENDIVGYATDWQREALRDAGIYNIQLGISGGKSDLRYYVSANLQEDQGLMKFSDYNKGNVKAKVSGKLSNKIKFDISFNPTFAKRDRPAVNFTDYYRFYSFLPAYHNTFSAQFVNQLPQWADIRAGDFAQARHFNGLAYSGYMPDGSYWQSSGVVTPWSTSNNTPLSIAARTKRYTDYYRMLGDASLSYEIIPNLELKSAFSGYYRQTNDYTFTKRNAGKDGNVNTGEIGNEQYIDLLWTNTLNYTKNITNNHFNLLLGYTAEKTTINTSNMFGEDFPTDDFKTLNQAGQINQAKTYTLRDEIGLVSYLGRLMYDYKGKYLFATSLRTDGSSYFSEGRKFGWFPSVSLGWVITGERFMETVERLNNLKIRASYGATGNNKIPSFAYQNLLYPANYDFGDGTGSVILGLAPNGTILANPNITWERTFEYNTGLDMEMLNSRLSITLDFYRAETDRLLLQQATMSFSGSNVFWNNAGSVRNQGFEAGIQSVNIDNKTIKWQTSLNISANKNKLVSLGGVPFLNSFGERNEVYTSIVGQPSIQFFGYKTDGVWLSDAEIADAKAKGITTSLAKYFEAGGLKVIDINGDKRIDADDRVPLGNPFPDFTWGITNTFSFSGFDVSILLQGSQGGKLINGDAFYNETKKLNRNFNSTERWVSAANPGDGATPYFTNGMDWMLTDYVMEDASYASLRNVIIGYSLPEKIVKKLTFKGARVYASADNVFYITGKSYRGINPEARNTSSAYSTPLIDGYQRGAFPIARTYTVGLDINF